MCYKNGKWSQFTLLTDIQNKKKEIQEGKIKIEESSERRTIFKSKEIEVNKSDLNKYCKPKIY